MPKSFFRTLVCTLLVTVSVGCGGGGGSGGGGGTSGTPVTFTFDDMPTAAAVQVGSDNFKPASLQGNSLSINVPDGSSDYSIAYVCPPATLSNNDTLVQEIVIQANIQDGTSLSAGCGTFKPWGGPSSKLTGSLDTTAVPGANSVWFVDPGGKNGLAYSDNGGLALNGPFTASMPAGTSDIAVLVYDGSPISNVLAAKILHNQTVPGVLNDGNVITFQQGDQMTSQPLKINVPSGFSLYDNGASFVTSGLDFALDEDVAGSSPQFDTEYLVMPAAALQSGDFYTFWVTAVGYTNGISQVSKTSFSTTGGGPVTLSLPAPYLYSGPAPAKLPTFTFDYSGFPTVLARQCGIGWSPAGHPETEYDINVTATANFQNGANTITIPNLASLSGFLASPASGTNVGWATSVFGGSAQPFPSKLIVNGVGWASNGNVVSQVQNLDGTYTVP